MKSLCHVVLLQVSYYRMLGALAAAGLPINDLAGLSDSPLGFDYRAHGLPYNPLFDKLFVTHCQLGSSSGMQGWNNERGPSMMAVRTVAIDDQLLEAMASPTPAAGSGSRSSPIPAAPSLPLASSSGSRGLHQVVILGAGLDARAWRLSWPSGTVVFEVDSGALEPLKQRVLGALPLACHTRHALVADLARPHQLRSALAQAGFQADQPVVWLMEGLIGYLTRRQARRLLRSAGEEGSGVRGERQAEPGGRALLLQCCTVGVKAEATEAAGQLRRLCLGPSHLNLPRCTYELSAPGSQLIVNCPPTAEDRAAAAAKGVQLHHKTFEDKHATLTRCAAPAWKENGLAWGQCWHWCCLLKRVATLQLKAAQPSPARPGPAQPSPAQPSPAQPSPAQPSPAQPSPAQPSPAQPSPAQPSPAQPSPAQPSPAQPSPAQPSPARRLLPPGYHCRVRHAGWTAELWDEESIAARYRLPCPRAHVSLTLGARLLCNLTCGMQICGCKSEPGRHGAWPLRLGPLSCAVM
ncbi:hypothetical protein QJQ45_021392 [Haematococcus lacustris]|nr:hypothetical protein QJQ45_021392 [Haematococcus lacustris]